MPEIEINGVTVNFPFQPYDVQTAYMCKVIECLENSTNGVLESPTGTGKTLSLLCSSLAWLQTKKAQIQANLQSQLQLLEEFNPGTNIETSSLFQRKTLAKHLVDAFNKTADPTLGTVHGVPKIIYASRTHSQITQAMRELKNTSYNYMKAAVIGSRDQLCIHPDLAKESNANKIQLCKIKISTRSCSFHNRLDKAKESPELQNAKILDIEDLVLVGRKLKCCPYYASKELMDQADIIFMPYNYLLDPKIRKANKVELTNTIIILDEAHNVEKMCEESASVQITSSEIALAISDIDSVLKPMSENGGVLSQTMEHTDDDKDFDMDDLVLLKGMLLELEKAVDGIAIKSTLENLGETFEGGYMFSLLEKASINLANVNIVTGLLDRIIQFLASDAETKNTVFRKGVGLAKVFELLVIVFSSTAEDFRARVSKCYKVYIELEQPKTSGSSKKTEDWFKPKAKTTAKKINYWCFSPGFGMQYLLGKNVRSIILTSGTLAPLKPLISELDIPISVNLENPHIVGPSQVCVKIISHGSDKELLISNYENRNNPKYVDSLGRTVLSFCPVVPGGLLVFFPSYGILNACKERWQGSGIWSQINKIKCIFIEPQTKDAFVDTMNGYYAKIAEPGSRGAVFMAVCRGKVSEGLDFANENGRAVIITGLPYPPYKDPKIVLKKQYLSDNRTRQNEMLSGQEWYFLEASRAVNQAIGRVIRHKDDYGAILLCDTRFNNHGQKSQLSAWLQGHLANQPANQTFGSAIGEVSRFFRNAERTLPRPALRELGSESFAGLSTSNNDSNKTAETSTFTFKSRPEMATTASAIANEKEEKKPIVKANDMFSWAMYKKPASYVKQEEKPKSLLSRLDEEVTSIDFNNTAGSSGVKIHKRSRPISNTIVSTQSETDLLDNAATKKRKFKIIPNHQSLSSFGSQLIMSTPSKIGDTGIKTEQTETIVINDDDDDDGDHEIKVEPQAPEDRVALLKLVKATIPSDKYMLFVQTFSCYQKNNNYEKFLSTMYTIFTEPKQYYLLKAMQRFLKVFHRERFERDVGNHITNKIV